MQGLHLGDLAEKIFRADMRTRADAGAAEGEAPTLPVVDELFQVFRRIAWMHGENVGTEGHDGDGAQIVDREALVFGRALIDRKGGGGGEEGVAVGRRAADRFRREIAAGATAVFHHHRMSEALAELLPNQAGDDVGNAAGREGNLQRDVLRRIGLRPSRLRDGGGGGHDEDQKLGAEWQHAASFHSSIVHVADIGVHTTSSIRVAPVASMTSRSKPSAIPQASGIPARALRKSSSIG